VDVFSLSAVGLTISLAGYDNFELLAGANEMDEHFKSTDFENNMPVVLALLSVWYNNFFGAESEALIPIHSIYKTSPVHHARTMEAMVGIGRDGKPVNYQTGTIIWGEPGTNAQCLFSINSSGTKLIPADFIGFVKPCTVIRTSR
jgi:glucose-6-phosphate isomerase